MAAGALAVGLATDTVPVREASSLAVCLAAGAALVVSIVRRKAGVAGERERIAKRSERVAAMTGIDRRPDPEAPTAACPSSRRCST